MLGKSRPPVILTINGAYVPRFRARHVLLILIITGAVCLVLAVRKPVDPDPLPSPVDEPPPSKADLSLQQVDYTHSRSGKKLWRLQAQSTDYRKEEAQTDARLIQVTFFDDTERPRFFPERECV